MLTSTIAAMQWFLLNTFGSVIKHIKTAVKVNSKVKYNEISKTICFFI